MSRRPLEIRLVGFVLFLFASCAMMGSTACGQLGPMFTAAGPVNRSMAGASTAAPLTASGALFWNPATLASLERSQLDVGADLVFPTTTLSSRVPASSLGPGFPAVDLSGTSQSEPNVFALPTMALSYRPEGSNLTYGFGIFAVSGFGLNYAGSGTNPLLTAPPPAGIGLGPLMAQYQALQIAPALVYQATPRFSVSASPLLDIGYLQLDPMLTAAPDDANGDSFATYPNGTHGRNAWGAGFSLGTYYRADYWSIGASYKSTQWFESYEFNSSNELGIARSEEIDLDIPSITSIGLAYHGFEYILLSLDFRYVDFANTDGYRESGYGLDGSLQGLGYDSIFGLALGTQFVLTDSFSVRLGYSYNDNPISSEQVTANAASPLIIQHVLNCGFSYQATQDLAFSAAYSHAFENEVSGTIDLPTGTIPGSSIQSTTRTELASFGATVNFGPRQ